MFTPEQQKKLDEWFKNLRTDCPACCQADSLKLTPTLVGTPVFIAGTETTLQRSRTHVVVECEHCGFTMMFSAQRLGIK
jgi:Zn ribbon nucleic-acid-binding protein